MCDTGTSGAVLDAVVGLMGLVLLIGVLAALVVLLSWQQTAARGRAECLPLACSVILATAASVSGARSYACIALYLLRAARLAALLAGCGSSAPQIALAAAHLSIAALLLYTTQPHK
ncbi:hypothetical protein H4R18_001169 [Coemansia javaensis]|uniref:Uncharacterized protein n=1 Tax=Coemansia javaensis TaxID=2761396 RepID=A0A9W8LJK2_9FUNG|nr:hypothetical protein H4R18_001169 [Coemansia javaensis]